MLDPVQNPLPTDVATLLAEAIDSGEASLLASALELARPGGYV